MRPRHILALIVFFFASLVRAEAFSVFHPSLESSQRDTLLNDYASLSQFSNAPDLQGFRHFQYMLNSGIKLIFGPSFNYSKEISYEKNDSRRIDTSSSFDTRRSSINLGLLYWILIQNGEIQSADYYFNNQGIQINSPTVGLIYLTEYFFEEGKASDARFNSFRRLKTLIHESKHSECTSSLDCGHAHIICPLGHALAGRSGCDLNWSGSIGNEARFIKLLIHSCIDCSTLEKQKLLLLLSESFSRILSETTHE